MKKTFIAILLISAALPAFAQAAHKTVVRQDRTLPEKIVPMPEQTEPKLPVLTLQDNGPVHTGMAQHVVATLRDENGIALTPDRMESAENQNIKFYIIDRSMSDYQAIEPSPGKKPGEYDFTFVPFTGYDHTIWADIQPVGKSKVSIHADMPGSKNCLAPCIDTSEKYDAIQNGYTFFISFDSRPVAGTPNRLQMEVMDRDGQLMSASRISDVGIIGFYLNDYGLFHVTPMPTLDGTPQFHVYLAHAGFIRLFAKATIAGQEMTVPFGIIVSDAGTNNEPLMAKRNK